MQKRDMQKAVGGGYHPSLPLVACRLRAMLSGLYFYLKF